MGAPVSYAVNAPRTGELVAWLRCNDVDLRNVPYPTTVFVESPDGEQWFIRHEVYVRTASGAIKYDLESNSFEYAERQTVMVSDPPMWWLEETAPIPTGPFPPGPSERGSDGT